MTNESGLAYQYTMGLVNYTGCDSKLNSSTLIAEYKYTTALSLLGAVGVICLLKISVFSPFIQLNIFETNIKCLTFQSAVTFCRYTNMKRIGITFIDRGIFF